MDLGCRAGVAYLGMSRRDIERATNPKSQPKPKKASEGASYIYAPRKRFM